MRGAILALALVCAAAPALAQPAGPDPAAVQPAASAAADPQPLVRATLTPARVVVGQPATLVVEVLAPNYMTKPPVLPDFQIANAITRAGSTMNFSERQRDVSFAGIRYSFLLTPQEPGRYAVPGQTVTLTYADAPPHTRTTPVPLPALQFEAVIPAAARSLDPFLSATRLRLSQEIQASSPALKVGDSVTRIVTLEAESAPAILLPPTPFAPLAGTRVYPSQPQLADGVDDGSGVLTSTRTDRATYMLEQAGTVTLPAIEIAWWDAKAETIRHARLDPHTVTVAGGSSLGPGGDRPAGLSAPRRLILYLLEHWQALVAVIVASAVALKAAPAVVGRLKRAVARRRALERQSEACAFRELSRRAGQDDPRLTYCALLIWLSRFAPAAPAHSIRALNDWAKDPVLAHELAALERRLFAASAITPSWSGAPLIRALRPLRRKAGLRPWNRPMAHALPAALNPGAAETPRPSSSRPVAR